MEPNPPPSQHQPEPKKLKMSTTTSDEDTTATTTTTTTTTDRKPRYKRRKVAIFLAYCGVGYQGMQKNPGAKTIEGDLEEALYLAGAVPEHDRGKPQRFEWARSARTDKGVSAVGQVVSGRFYVDPPGFVDRLHSHLPNQIRIFGYKRVTNSFSAKKFCDRRRYVYLIPVFALDPNAHPNRESVLASLGSGNELVKCLGCSERGRKVFGVMGRRNSEGKIDGGDGVESGVDLEASLESVTQEKMELNVVQCSNGEEKQVLESGVSLESTLGPVNEEKMVLDEVQCGNGEEKLVLESGVSLESTLEQEKMELDLVKCSNGEEKGVFVYGEKEKEKFNRILNNYVGTHNFHNFTTRTKAEDPAAKRYIVSFNANSIVTVDGMDFVKCEVVGQSFMLHQIRKMIGLAVAIMRNCAPELLIETALQQDVNITVPMAPEVGLYLEECFFTSYNQKWKGTHEEISMKSYAEEAENFKMKQVYSHIAAMEQKEGSVALWLHSLNYRNYPDLRFEVSKGIKTDGESEACTTNGESEACTINGESGACTKEEIAQVETVAD